MCQTIAPGMKNWVESYCFWTDVSWTYLTDTSVCTCWGTMWTTGPRYTQKQEHSGDTQTCLQFLTKRYNLTSLGAVGQIGECLISHNLINMIHDQFSFSFYSPYKRQKCYLISVSSFITSEVQHLQKLLRVLQLPGKKNPTSQLTLVIQ